jgi:predicted metal-dependent hydrolase
MGIDYTLVRSRRKTMAIYITKDAGVEVRAPLKTPKSEADRFVAAKEDWIMTNLAARRDRLSDKAAFTLNCGDMIAFCGKAYPIRAQNDYRAGFDGECFYIPADLPQAHLKQVIVRVYKLLAKRILTAKTVEYAKRMNVMPASVKISSAKTRWGSCSIRKNINFSWRLMMADEDVIDYVVVHELAHIKELNHSSRFWAAVAEILPDYAERKQKLKILQEKLSREDWD